MTRIDHESSPDASGGGPVTLDDPVWDDPWHGVVWSAFVSEARAAHGWPDSKAVKRRAYAAYEEGSTPKDAAESAAWIPCPSACQPCSPPPSRDAPPVLSGNLPQPPEG